MAKSCRLRAAFDTGITSGERDTPVEDICFSDSFRALSYFLAQDDRADDSR